MNVGLDAEGLLAIYADWLAFLQEKRGMFEAQLAKLQGKAEKQAGKQAADLVAPAMPEPPLPEASFAVPLAEARPHAETAPAWLFQADPAPEEAEGVAPTSEVDELDEWM